jgi:hypothetical protein
MTALIDESVLCRRVGGPSVMAEQLSHLLVMSEWVNVGVRVLPFSVGLVRAHAGPFVLLEIPAELGSDVVYTESHAHNQYLDSESDVDQYRSVHARSLEVALSPDESREVIDGHLARHRAADHSPR